MVESHANGNAQVSNGSIPDGRIVRAPFFVVPSQPGTNDCRMNADEADACVTYFEGSHLV